MGSSVPFLQLGRHVRQGQTGSASFLSVALIVPLLCIVCMLGLELAGYFATTSRNQEVADEAARIGTKFGGYTPLGIEAARRFIDQSLPFSTTRQVSVGGSIARLEVSIDEPIELPFLNLLIKVTGGSASQAVSSVALSEVRRLHLQSEVVLEIANRAGSLCETDVSKGAYALADKLGASLHMASGTTPYLSVQPGSLSLIERTSNVLCSSQSSFDCTDGAWISEELLCNEGASAKLRISPDGFRDLLQVLLEREVANSKSDAVSFGQPRIVYRVSYRPSTGSRADVSLYDFEIAEIGQYLRERSGHLDILDIEVLPENLSPSDGDRLEIKNDWGTIRRISVSGAAQIEPLVTNLAALVRREVIAQ